MEKIVDVERLNRHLSEVTWAPTVEISRTELLALLSRLEQAEQAVQRVREVVGEDAPSFFTNEAMRAYDKAMSEITLALDGE